MQNIAVPLRLLLSLLPKLIEGGGVFKLWLEKMNGNQSGNRLF